MQDFLQKVWVRPESLPFNELSEAVMLLVQEPLFEY